MTAILSEHSLKAYAKLNLFLHIVGKGEVFHELESLFVFLDLYDDIRIKPNESVNVLKFSGGQSDLIPIHENSITLFFKLLKIHTGIEDMFSVHVHKNIPIASGLGGGSVDAAALILFFQEVYGFSDLNSFAIAEAIGSDTLSCAKARWRPSFIRGHGEIVSTADLRCSKWAVVVNPYTQISAKHAYSLYERPFSESLGDVIFDDDFLSSIARNDLERFVAAEYPIITRVLQVIDSSDGVVFSRMSGSGATCYGLFALESDARGLVENAKKHGWWAECATIRV